MDKVNFGPSPLEPYIVLQQQLDAAKQDRDEWKAIADNWMSKCKTFAEKLLLKQEENERLKAMNPEFWQLYDRYENKIAEKLQVQDKLKQAIEALEKIASMDGYEVYGDLHQEDLPQVAKDVLSLIREEAEKENPHEK